MDNKKIDVFIDLDDTLVYSSFARGEFDSYNLAHGGREFLLALNNIPNVRINFYSGASHDRNESLVARIMGSLNTQINYSVFSKQHLNYSFHPGFISGFGYLKELRTLKTDIDMERAILIDDKCSHSAQGEERNLLYVYKFRKYPVLVKNNLVRVLGMLLWAIELSKNKGCTLVGALSAMQWDKQGEYRHLGVNAKTIYDLGLSAMRVFNPEFELWGSSVAYQEQWCELSRELKCLIKQDIVSKLPDLSEVDLVPSTS